LLSALHTRVHVWRIIPTKQTEGRDKTYLPGRIPLTPTKKRPGFRFMQNEI
jgi:hypothetical protein